MAYNVMPLLRTYKYTTRSVPVALLLTIRMSLRSSYSVKTKAYSYAFYMYICLPNLSPKGFQQVQHYKINVFSLNIA